MASSSGKPTAVHFSLIFFVMMTIICGVVAYIMYREYDAAEKRYQTANKDATDKNRVALDRDGEIQALKTRLGIQYADVGNEDTPNTVLWQIGEDLKQYGSVPPGATTAQLPSVHDALIEMRRQMDQLQADYNKTVADLKGRNDEYNNLRAAYQTMVDAANAQTAEAERIRGGVQDTLQEKLDAADKQYQDKVAELVAEKEEHRLDKEAGDKRIAALEEEVRNLALINVRVQEKLDNIQKVSFEIEDGEVRWVDHNSRLVWINLGEDDILAKRTTFSVYKKGHNGIGRGAEDIKAAIEVTRIIGPHLAEARVLPGNDIYEPIAPGDPIYTPLWSPGRSESFAIVGFIDVDGDGRSDRDLLKEHIAATGARFNNEVLDDGTRKGDGIDVSTKFFVVADLPDPSTTADDDEKKLYGEILKHFSDMEKEARQQGVRKISLGDFLAYIGYRPSRRLWRPGEGSAFKLKSGAASTATNENIGNRESSGQTSGVYSGGQRLKAPQSPGEKKKLYGGGR